MLPRLKTNRDPIQSGFIKLINTVNTKIADNLFIANKSLRYFDDSFFNGGFLVECLYIYRLKKIYFK